MAIRWTVDASPVNIINNLDIVIVIIVRPGDARSTAGQQPAAAASCLSAMIG
jgi:hypothetical protein